MAGTDTLDIAATNQRETERNSHGDFIWYELITTDPDAATDFYRRVIGWHVRSSGMEGMDYRLISASGAESSAFAGKDDVGGLMKLTDAMAEMKPAWFGYIGVEDVDKAAEKIRQAGGSIHIPPTDIPNVGRFAFVADPQGIPFYVMRGNSNQKSEAHNPLADGHGAWNELVTTDQAAALNFYIDQFGWEKGDALPMGEAGDYRFINHDGEMIGAVMNRIDSGNSVGNDQPPKWNFYFRVPSIAKAAETITANGGSISYGPAEIPGGDYVVNATDPQGATFGLVGPNKA